MHRTRRRVFHTVKRVLSELAKCIILSDEASEIRHIPSDCLRGACGNVGCRNPGRSTT